MGRNLRDSGPGTRACGCMSLSLPRVETQHKEFSLSAVAESFNDLRSRPALVSVVLFVLFYKLGDLAMGPMVRPFWLARGLSLRKSVSSQGPWALPRPSRAGS